MKKDSVKKATRKSPAKTHKKVAATEVSKTSKKKSSSGIANKKTTSKKSAAQTREELAQHYGVGDPETETAGMLQSSFHAEQRLLAPTDYEGTFPIVAIGASAGGIEGFMELMGLIPIDTGMAFVLIQHLSPNHESLLQSIVARSTKMKVNLAKDGVRIQPNEVYVIQPNTNIGIIRGELRSLPRLLPPKQHMPVDFFFRCLADDQKHFGIGVILSGADGDGAQGLKAMNGQGGLTLVQTPSTAKVDGMPKSAIAAGGTDTVLPISEIAKELVRFSKHPLALSGQDKLTPSASDLAKVFAIIKAHSGVDFSKYRQGTVNRRLRRRILLLKNSDLSEYVGVLRRDHDEQSALYDDLLINVTNFFRDPGVFENLRETVARKLIRAFEGEGSIRIWVPGCSTGEEAYSIAIVFSEAMELEGRVVPLQIFASDISEKCLVRGREAIYPESIHADVSIERLRKYFIKAVGGYRISSSIRESVIFARQDLLRDPPFSRMDLISCRNLLIYLKQEEQKKVLNSFAYALNPRSYLQLGSSEAASPSEGFENVDKRNKVFVRKTMLPRVQFELPAVKPQIYPAVKPIAKPLDGNIEIEREVNRLLIERYAPSGVVVDSRLQIIKVRGSTGDYLEPSQGEMTFDLFKMARGGLNTELRILVNKAQKSEKLQSKTGVFVTSDAGTSKITVEVIPFKIFDDQVYFLIVFKKEVALTGSGPGHPTRISENADSVRGRSEARRVREELAAAQEHLQSIIREQDFTNEELQAANEEILSSNEELQSTNEELETAKEELQSTNEELTTVNDELSDRNGQLQLLNNDLSNLLASVNLPIIMVGNDLRLRRFTPMSERLLNVIATDVGRPITDIKPNLDIPDLEKLIVETIDSMRTIERDVQDKSGHWYSLRIRPYRTDKNKIDGAVLILVDVDRSRTTPVSGALHVFAIDTVEEPIVVLDRHLRMLSTNRAYHKCFQTTSQDVIGQAFFDLADGGWSQPMLKALLSGLLQGQTQLHGFNFDGEFPPVGSKRFTLNGQKITYDGAASIMITISERLENQ